MHKRVVSNLPRLALILLLTLVSVGLPVRVAAAEALPVVASFSILGDLTQQIGGDRVQLHTLVGPGADAHVYQPTPADAKVLSRARLVVVNGLGFEGWIDRLIKSSGYRGKRVVASQGINAIRQPQAHSGKHEAHDHTGGFDPHAWQDLANARRYVANITPALVEADPAGKTVYQANAARLDKEIAALDSEIRSTFSALPADRRKVVTSHDAFAYFGRAYGIRMFVENIADPRLLERISRESGARIGGTLYSDSLSAAGTPADSYLGMMRQNAKTLAAALAD